MLYFEEWTQSSIKVIYSEEAVFVSTNTLINVNVKDTRERTIVLKFKLVGSLF